MPLRGFGAHSFGRAAAGLTESDERMEVDCQFTGMGLNGHVFDGGYVAPSQPVYVPSAIPVGPNVPIYGNQIQYRHQWQWPPGIGYSETWPPKFGQNQARGAGVGPTWPPRFGQYQPGGAGAGFMQQGMGYAARFGGGATTPYKFGAAAAAEVSLSVMGAWNGAGWVNLAAPAIPWSQVLGIQKRVKRTVLTSIQRSVLEDCFHKQPYPLYNELAEIANNLQLHVGTVLKWFSDRRSNYVPPAYVDETD